MKNMKIMAILSLLITSTLLVGAASAADAEISVVTDKIVYSDGDSIIVTFIADTNAVASSSIDVTYGTTQVSLHPSDWSATNMSTLTLTAEYGVTEIYFSQSEDSLSNDTISFLTQSPLEITTSVAPSGYREVFKGSDAFVYEHIFIEGATGKLTKYSEGNNPTALNQISGTDETFYLTESAVNGQYGTYYYEGSPKDGSDSYVYIWYPEITLQVELANDLTGATTGTSLDGKTINKGTMVTFLINSPKVAPAMPAFAKISFTTPAGGKTTIFGSDMENSLENIILNDTQTVIGGMTLGNVAEAGTWTAQAEYLTTPFNDYAKKSNTVSFTVQSTALELTAAKESVVRSNPFTVTIHGDSQMMYFVYLDGASASDSNPTLQPGQPGMKTNYYGANGIAIPAAKANKSINPLVDGTKVNLQKTWGYFETDTSGLRTVQYNTADNTEDKTYTVKVYAVGKKYLDMEFVPEQSYVELNSGADYDSAKVKVEKGSITITSPTNSSFYIGDEIKLSGTNTDSDLVYLFITGSNLKENGIVLKDLPAQNDAYTASNPISVKTDGTWEYKWDTSKIALDTGAYTVYATSVLTNGKSSYPIGTNNKRGALNDGSYNVDPSSDHVAVKLSDSEYATVSVNLKQPFLSASPSGAIVAKGDKIYISGTAEGHPSALTLYIFGPNKFASETITVEDNGSYKKKLDIGSDWSSNQYFVVVQHPMYNGVFDAKLNTEDVNSQFFYIDTTSSGGQIQGTQSSFYVTGNNKLQGSNAADALTKMIDSSNIDDIYTKLTFTVAEPMINVNNPGAQEQGTLTISGTTNLAVEDQILVEVMSSSFTATDKTATDMTSGVSQTAKVVENPYGGNVWSVTVDTLNWKIDEYTIKAAGIEVGVTTTTNFSLIAAPAGTGVKAGQHPTKVEDASQTHDAIVSTLRNSAAKNNDTTIPTRTPGFGAFIALAGLGAVTLLAHRRN